MKIKNNPAIFILAMLAAILLAGCSQETAQDLPAKRTAAPADEQQVTYEVTEMPEAEGPASSEDENAEVAYIPSSVAYIPSSGKTSQPAYTPAGEEDSLGTALNINAPDETIRLVFIHHSTGENWLNDEYGGLGNELSRNNYFVSDTNYGWGPDGIGDLTDIVDWPKWFRGQQSSRYLHALYSEDSQNSAYTRILEAPDGENTIVMFKSCFPNSEIEGSPEDAAEKGDGLTVGNAKYIYNDILKYFATRPDKLFIAVTAPPVSSEGNAENARAFNNWLVNDWLDENHYNKKNVAVFDFYNVLTGKDNHHRVNNGVVEHITDTGGDTSYYPTDPGEDDHPSPKGSQKATNEFVPWLNAAVNCWQGEGGCP